MRNRIEFGGIGGARLGTALLATMTLSGAALAAAEVTTDLAAYPPGASVLIDGTAFLPDELVMLIVEHPDGVVDCDHAPWLAAASDVGAFGTDWFTCDESCSECSFVLTAIGVESGEIATAEFAGAEMSVTLGACCLDDGSCHILFEAACDFLGGDYQGNGTSCGADVCGETGACCGPIPGFCRNLGEEACEDEGGVYLGDDSDCTGNPCVGPPGACCLPIVALCVDLPQVVCDAIQGTFAGEGTRCEEGLCAGACCLLDDTCIDTTPILCHLEGGEFFGPGSRCANGTNTAGGSFVECAPPEPERPHAGWNWVDNMIALTPDQPTYWSAATGLPSNGGLSPFSVLDPGDPPGRPANDGTGDRVLRGYVLAWAVNAEGAEVRYNHLKGEGTILNYEHGFAWEYNTLNHQVVSGVDQGAESDGTSGVLKLDGAEYSSAFDQLVLNFQAAESVAWGDPDTTCAPYPIISDTDVTLHPVSADLRQETDGPVTTKAHITVWNENETKFSGAYRCITCWDQQLLSLYDAPDGGPNHFVRATLQTDHGKARIDGVASQLCDVDYDPTDGMALGEDPRDIVSEDAALAGAAARRLHLDPFIGPNGEERHAAAGSNLVGMGFQDATIEYDTTGGSQEATWPETPAGLLEQLGLRHAKARTGNVEVGATRGGTAGEDVHEAQALIGGAQDRGSATEKGSLVIFHKVELRWRGEAPYDLLQDTFLSLTNDGGDQIDVQMYFINGDPPLAAEEP